MSHPLSFSLALSTVLRLLADKKKVVLRQSLARINIIEDCGRECQQIEIKQMGSKGICSISSCIIMVPSPSYFPFQGSNQLQKMNGIRKPGWNQVKRKSIQHCQRLIRLWPIVSPQKIKERRQNSPPLLNDSRPSDRAKKIHNFYVMSCIRKMWCIFVNGFIAIISRQLS